MDTNLFKSQSPAVPLRGIHLDLKGLTPTFPRLLELLTLFYQLKFQAVLVEWEDMFPWSCDKRLQSPNAYTPSQVKRFADRCNELGLEIIPLVQSLGHSENVLRLPGNESLREIPHRTDVFHPLNPLSSKIVSSMLENVLALLPNVKRLHLGCDEVYTLGENPASHDFIQSRGKAELYMLQLDPLFQKLEKHDIRPMLWHDEIVKWTVPQIQSLSKRADLVAWGYTGNPRDSTTYHHRLPHLQKLYAAGCTLWGATAYKGADGPNANLPETHTRQISTLGWAELTSTFNLQGVFATGWSRYASGRIQVTPIDAALDSLVNTAVILHNGSLPDGGLDACHLWLNENGEGEAFRQLQQILQNLTTHTDNAWRWLRELEEQAANIEIEPTRANSGIEEIIFEILDTEIQGMNETGAKLITALEERITPPLARFYSESRLRPVQTAAERLRTQLCGSESNKNSLSS